MENVILKNLHDAIRLKQPETVPVAIWNTGPFIARFNNMKIGAYSKSAELKLKAQTQFQLTFPNVVMVPGIDTDFGVGLLPSAFGCEVLWYEDEVPYINPAIHQIQEIGKLRGIDLRKSGLIPEAIETYRYFWKNIDRSLIERYGYLEGHGLAMGPVEVAALVVGYSQFLIEIIDHPELIHTLLKMTTEACLEWMRIQEEINGKLKRMIIIDHIPGQVGPSQLEEFCLPYYQAVFKEYPEAIKVYHNENNVARMLPGIAKIGADVFHFGIGVKEAKEGLGSKMCLMGNLLAVGNLLKGTPEQVFQEATDCLDIGAVGGGFLLSTAGGLAPGTPKGNIEAMIRAAWEWKPKGPVNRS